MLFTQKSVVEKPYFV